MKYSIVIAALLGVITKSEVNAMSITDVNKTPDESRKIFENHVGQAGTLTAE